MSFGNYTELKSEVANYLGRSDLTTQIPTFIELAEIRLGRDTRFRQMLKSVTATTTASDPRIALPSDFLEIRDLTIQGSPRTPLSYLSPSKFSRDSNADVVGTPVFYTILSAEFQFAPKPDRAFTLELLYYAKPAFLSDSNSSNVFLANCPDLLLYGALLEAQPYLVDDKRIPVWSGLYDRGVKNLSDASEKSEYSGVPITMSLTTR
jgi:hypothetical protein